MCQYKNVIPKYAKITIKCTSKTVKQTLWQATKLRINNEIKHLYTKKQNINKQLKKKECLIQQQEDQTNTKDNTSPIEEATERKPYGLRIF
jgi:hypothetical protein